MFDTLLSIKAKDLNILKSGKNKRSISLTNFVDKYKPQHALKFTFNYVENNPERVVQPLPIYKIRSTYTQCFQNGDDKFSE